MSVLLMLIALFVLVLINVPIAVALGLIAAVAMVAKAGMDNLLGAAVVMFEGATKFPLIAIPLFVLAGAIMNTTGISRRLIAFASACLGFIRGGLSMVNIGTSMFFAEISGSAVADVAAIGSILIPAMERRGYPKELAAARSANTSSARSRRTSRWASPKTWLGFSPPMPAMLSAGLRTRADCRR